MMMVRVWILLLLLVATIQAENLNWPVLHDELVASAEGYFANAGGNGGQGGEVVYVTQLGDNGLGSLRSYLESTETLIVIFENDLNGVINLATPIKVESNKTLWGRHRDGTGADVLVHPASSIATAFRVTKDRGNVIFANLKADAPGPDDSAPDWILIRDTGTVWVHHVTAIGDNSMDMDGFVDIHAPNVTCSWNLVRDWSNVHLVYPVPDDNIVTLTLHHNLFINNHSRHPRLVRSERLFAHLYNNVTEDWVLNAAKAVTGQIRAEANIYKAKNDEMEDALLGDWGGSDNIFLNGATADPQSSGIFVPPYSYDLDPTDGLRDMLEANAGWQAFDDLPPTDPPTESTVRRFSVVGSFDFDKVNGELIVVGDFNIQISVDKE